FLLCIFAALFTASIAAVGIRAAMPLPPVLVASMPLVPPAVELQPSSTTAATPQRTRIGSGNAVPNNAVVPPQIIESSQPAFTTEALAANVEGTVTLEGHVDTQGRVSALRVIKGLGYGLDQKAIDAVLSWKFRPALRTGSRVEAIMQIEVDFRIQRESRIWS